MNSNSFFYCSINIIVNWGFFENLLNRESSSGNLKNGSITKEARKLLSIRCRRRDDEFDVSSFLCNLFENTKKHISIKTSFMGLVHNDGTVHLKFWVIQTFSEKHTVSHVLYHSFLWSTILKTDWVSNFGSQRDTHFFWNSLCNTYSCDSSWLSAADRSVFPVAVFHQILSHLCGFSTSCLPNNNDDFIFSYDSP